MREIDWHSAPLDHATVITPGYRNTQNVRRFFKAACGPDFKLDRDFMAWMKAASGRTMGDAATEWLSRRARVASAR
jgi:hypothetical protein